MNDINFTKKSGSNLFTLTTDKGNSIGHTLPDEDKLVILTKENANSEENKPTVLQLECNFKVTSEMLDLLQKSKIIEVIGRKHHQDANIYEVTYYPLAHFDYILLQDIIVDMCNKFNL